MTCRLGCRLGNRCPFLHDPTGIQKPRMQLARAQSEPDAGPALPEARRYVVTPVDRSRVVKKPVTSTQEIEPREFELRQLRRRFSPQESQNATGSSLVLRMTPSDPDFPFEIDTLDCVLDVPLGYPGKKRPSLRVTNRDIPRGHQINVEKGFDELLQSMPQATLLQLMNALDKNLERYLAEEKRATIKLVSNIGHLPKPRSSAEAERESLQSSALQDEHDAAKKSAAKARRDAETLQLEARLGSLPDFSKSTDGLSYTIPLELRKRDELPVPLQATRAAKLFVPLLYNLQPCRVELLDVSRDAARRTEAAFQNRAKDHPEMTLMAHINHLAQSLHLLATTDAVDNQPREGLDLTGLSIPGDVAVTPQRLDDMQDTGDDRRHLKLIPKPPEWSIGNKGLDEDSDSSALSETDSDEDMDEQAAAEHVPVTSSNEKGTAVLFPSIELYGIELLELVSLSITVRCERCKQTMDVAGLRHQTTAHSSGVRSVSCGKCANGFSIGMSVTSRLGRWSC